MGPILIVDDDPTLREVLRAILEEEGYIVLEADEGKTALHLLHTSRERLVVLLDYLMPGVDGRGVVQAVCRDAVLATRHAYILLTARARISLPVLELADTLSMPVMRKPFDLEDMLLAVAQAQQRVAADASAGCGPAA